jgi:hypothetical protein
VRANTPTCVKTDMGACAIVWSARRGATDPYGLRVSTLLETAIIPHFLFLRVWKLLYSDCLIA